MADNPFLGARSFEEGDKDRFFGREREAYDLEALAVAHRSVLLYAPSGAGKTSLLKARLKPGLAEIHGAAAVEIARLGLRPRAGAEPANPLVASVLSSLLAGEEADRTLADGLGARLAGTKAPFFLILDQFEELFTATSDHPEQRQGFLGQLADALAAHPRVSVVFALREDYLPQLDALRHLMPDGLRSRLRLGFLEQAAARQAICRPLAALAPPIELPAAALDKLVAELARSVVIAPGGGRAEVSGPIEPVYLQVVCWRLAEDLLGRTRGQAPTAAAMAQVVDAYFAERPLAEKVQEALADYYRHGVARTAADAKVPEHQIRRFLATRLITEQRTRGLVPGGETETAGLANAAVKALEERYLIRREDRRGLFWYELAHDRLIEPVLAERSELETRAWFWDQQGRRNDLLLPRKMVWRNRPRLREVLGRLVTRGQEREDGSGGKGRGIAFLWPERTAEERELLWASGWKLAWRGVKILTFVVLPYALIAAPLLGPRIWVSVLSHPLFEIEQQVFDSDPPPDRAKALLLLLVHHDFATATAYRRIHPFQAELRARSRRLLLAELAQGPPPLLGPDAPDAALRARACELAGRNLSQEELDYRTQDHSYLKERDYLSFAYTPCPQFPNPVDRKPWWSWVGFWRRFYDALDRLFPLRPRPQDRRAP